MYFGKLPENLLNLTIVAGKRDPIIFRNYQELKDTSSKDETQILN